MGSIRLDSGTDSIVWMGEELAFMCISLLLKIFRSFFIAVPSQVLSIDPLFVCTFCIEGGNHMLSKGFIFEFNGRNLAKIGVLSALAFLLMLISFPIPLFPMFLEIDISDLPALLGAFALGPLAGVIIELMKNVLNIALEGTKTGFVGELSNFIVGSAFVMPASIVYMRSKNKQNALYGMIVGIMSMTIIACFSNYYLIVPLYSKANKLIVDMKSYILFAVIPFNILKSSLVSLITLLIYKKLSPILHM